MENKGFFHKKNYFSISSIPRIPNYQTLSNYTYLKRFKYLNLNKNQKNRQKIIQQKEINKNSSINYSHRTPHKIKIKKNSFNDYSNIERNINNKTINYSKNIFSSLIKMPNSENKKNPLNYSTIHNGPSFTPNKHLSSNIIKKNILEKINDSIFTPNKRLSSHIIKSNRVERANPPPISISNLKKSNINSRNSNILKQPSEIKSSRKEIKVNLFKNLKILPKKNLFVDENEKYDSKKKNNEAIIKKLVYNLNTIYTSESENNRKKNLIHGISYTKKICELCHKLVDKHIYKFHYYSHPSQILNWMYLGNFKNANNLEEIRQFKIKYILNCAFEVEVQNIPEDVKYCHIPLTDNNTTDITQYFEQAFNLIELARKKREKILIHCKLGISRSASIIIGYLIKYLGYTASSALTFLKTKRPKVNPNPGFISQLNSYENVIKKIQRKSNISNYSKADFQYIKN